MSDDARIDLSDALLFQVPVYRTSPDVWTREVNDYVGEAMQGIEARNPPMSVESKRHHADLHRAVITRGLPRDYNDVVGWVELVRTGRGVIKGYGFRTEQRRIRRGFDPRYVFILRVFECRFYPGEIAETFVSELRQRLRALTRRSGKFPGRWIDLQAFDAISADLDWPRLVGL
jgi:hypothetical protein